jgi:hypothetical protein
VKQFSATHGEAFLRLKEYAGRVTGDTDIFRFTDQQTFERLSALLYLRRILVTVREQRTAGGSPTQGSESAPPAFPLSERPRAAASSSNPSQQNDPATFSPNLDAAALAGALAAAAANGSPFCAECQKSKAAAGAGSVN